jgi:uncharacterized membrane protein YeaQ/YmgE (transglycosylase-associated protein family)
MIVLLWIALAVLAVFVVGWLVVGLVFKLLWWALVGLVIGGLARAVLPGRQQIGVVETALVGIGSALLGGLIAHIAGVGTILQFLIALVVAIVIVAAVGSSRPHAS